MAKNLSKAGAHAEATQDVLKLLGSGSIAVTGAAALFTTVYLAGLEPIDRLLTWPERVELALISVTWQVALLLLVILSLLAARVCQRRFPRSPWAAGAAFASGNALAAAATLFGLDSFTWIWSAQIYSPPILAAVVSLLAYLGARALDRRVFDRTENLLLIGIVAAVAWVAAGGWSKAHHDLARPPADQVLLAGKPLQPDTSACVIVILADDRMVSYIDDGVPKYRERAREDGRLTAEPCPINP